MPKRETPVSVNQPNEPKSHADQPTSEFSAA